MTDVLLFSPGVDSFISDWMLKSKGGIYRRVHFELDTRYANAERDFLEHLYSNKYLDYDFRLCLGDWERDDAFVPNRNALLVLLAQAKYDADTVYLSGTRDDRAPDNNEIFRKSMENLLSVSARHPVRVVSPLEGKEKVEWCLEYILSHDDKSIACDDLFEKTFSCFHPPETAETSEIFVPAHDNRYELFGRRLDDFVQIRERPSGCNRCTACFRRNCALMAARYYIPFKNKMLMAKYTLDESLQQLPFRWETIRQYNAFMAWYENVYTPTRLSYYGENRCQWYA